MNKREQIEKEIDIQESIEGCSENTKLLRGYLKIITSSRQWDAFIKCDFHQYGVYSYECHRFYYPKPELLKLIKFINSGEIG